MTATLLTLKETAARLKSTPDQVIGLVGDGKLKYINVGRGRIKPRYRFAPADIDEFEDKQRVLERPKCQFSRPQSRRRISGLTSKPVAVGFTALRAAQIAKKPKSLKR